MKLTSLIAAAGAITLGFVTAQWLGWFVRDPITTLRDTGEFVGRTAPVWLALLAWWLRGLVERQRRLARRREHIPAHRSFRP